MDNGTTGTREPIPRAQARRGLGNSLVVDDCPYCHGSHSHQPYGPDDDLIRAADCFRGEYRLVIQSDRS